MAVETFKVAGVTHYEDNIRQLAIENDDYHLSNRELKEEYGGGDRIYEFEFDPYKVELIPEPDNPHDPNAVRVEIDGLTVGHIKKGSCTHVKNLLASPDFRKIEVKSMGMGRYKELYEDEDGRLQVDNGKYNYCWVHISIITDAVATRKVTPPKAPGDETPARESSKFVSFASLEKAPEAATEHTAPSEPRLPTKKGKALFVAMRVLCVILGLLGLVLGLAYRFFWLLVAVAIWGWGKATVYLER